MSYGQKIKGDVIFTASDKKKGGSDLAKFTRKKMFMESTSK